MARGWHVWVSRFTTVVACTLLMLLAACTPVARAPSSGSGTNVAPVDSGIGPLESGRSYAFGQMLAREQERNVALQQQLDERGQQIDQLQAEVQQLRQQAAEWRAAADREASPAAAALAVDTQEARPAEGGADKQGEGAPPAPAPAAVQAEAPGDAPAPPEAQGGLAVIASLRVALTQEQQRREAAETQLERLKEETSTPPLAAPGDPAVELATAKSEIVDLRDALAAERAQRERLADELRALQEQPARAPQTEDSPENAELEARIDRLRAEKDAVTENFNRSLAASQQRTAELERQLAAAQAAAAADTASDDSDGKSVRADNQALRARLDEEHRRTEELAAKLRVATRVTDLIFKMQAQQAQAPPLAVR